MRDHPDAPARFDLVVEESVVAVQARTTVNTITMTTTDVIGYVNLEVTARDAFLPERGLAGRVELRADALHSGNALYDREGARRFDARRYPLIAADLVSATRLGGSDHRATWRLNFHGVTRDVDGDLLVRRVDADTVVLEGGHDVDVRNWGVQPGGFLMLRVHPDASFHVHLVAHRAREVQGV